MGRLLVIVWLLACAGYGVHVAHEAVAEKEHPSLVIYMFGVGAFTAFLGSGMVIGTLVVIVNSLL